VVLLLSRRLGERCVDPRRPRAGDSFRPSGTAAHRPAQPRRNPPAAASAPRAETATPHLVARARDLCWESLLRARARPSSGSARQRDAAAPRSRNAGWAFACTPGRAAA
jgi:hypothetical protein